jgi:hypothetical protein
MADLIDRISGADATRPKINLHRFMAYERLYAMGEWTRAEIATALDLQGSEATQAGQIADKIDAAGNINNKIVYIARVESVFMSVEDHQDPFYHSAGVVNKAKCYEDLQITG